MKRVATKELVILLLLDALGLLFLIPCRHVAGNGLTLSSGFSAL